jgi:serine protease Do
MTCGSSTSRRRSASEAGRRPSQRGRLFLILISIGLAGCRWKDRESTQPAPTLDAPHSFVPLARRLTPAVVGVYTTLNDETQSLGTGVIIDPSGEVLTNNHVIADREGRIQVRFADGHRATARLVGRDEDTDVALLQIEGDRRFTAAPLGDSDKVEVGEWVIAIGQPFGLSHSVTAGIISGKGRTALDMQAEPKGHGYWYYLQTDASINPGNSGGPLIDMRGTVVGINTMIHSEQRVSRVGFAIPISLIKIILPQLRKEGLLVRTWIGVEPEAIDPDDESVHGLPGGRGVRVRDVRKESPAERAGLHVGDVITSFDGRAVSSDAELRWLASTAGVRTVPVGVWRGGRVQDVRVKLEKKPDEKSAAGGK